MYIEANEQGIKVVPATKSWRLVHDGIKVIVLEEQDFAAEAGGTLQVFVAATKAEAQAEVTRLRLAPLPEATN